MALTRIAFASIVLAGCLATPARPRDDAAVADAQRDGAGDSAACAGAWTTPTPLTELTNLVTGEPTITGDKLQLFWSVQNSATSWEIHWASRDAVTDIFSDRGTLPIIDNPSGIDQDPSISDDGLVLMYRVGANEQGAELHEVTRSAATDAWGNPATLAGLTTVTPASLDLSADGLTVYYVTSQTLRSATRGSRTAAFTQNGVSLGTMFRFPAISGDELTLYYEVGTSGSIYRTVRGSTTSAFPAGSVLFNDTNLHDVDVTADETTLVVATRDGNTIAISTRCP